MPLTPTPRAKARRLAAELGKIGLTLPGTILRRETRCGRANCRCHADPPQLHGPYWWWTRIVDGKTVTRMLTDELYEDYRALFDDQRRARALLSELDTHGLAAREIHPRYAQRPARSPPPPALPVHPPP